MIKSTNFITADQARANVAKYLADMDPIWNKQALKRIGVITECINANSLQGRTSYKAPVSQDVPEISARIIKALRNKPYSYTVSKPYTESSHYVYIDISW